MRKETLRLGVVQMTSVDDVAANVRAVEMHYRSAARDGAQLVVFPENTLFFRIHAKCGVREPTADQWTAVAAVVNELGVPMLLTTAAEPRDGRFANATYLLERDAAPKIVYEKTHMFDTAVGGDSVRESEHFRPGDGARSIEVAGWRIGLSICYDLRFSELYLKYAGQTDLILVPSAFMTTTGPAHWHVLLRARAIEAQAFVVAPAQVGPHRSGAGSRDTYGHALIVGPWGDVRLDAERTVGAWVVELRKSDVNKMRQQIPVADHRRPC